MVVCFDEWRVAICLADVSRQVRAVLHGPFVEESSDGGGATAVEQGDLVLP
jgi:hypothetical protein